MLKCDHCLLPFPERDAVRQEIDNVQHVFCCNGCMGVFLLINKEGLEDFYIKRKWESPGAAAGQNKEIDLKLFTDDVRDLTDCSEIDIFIDGIRCASCIWLNEKFLLRTEGVEYARVNFATHKAKIRWNPQKTGLDRILRRILSIGYTPRPYRESEQYRLQKAESRDLLVRFGTAAFLSSQLMIYSIALYAGYFQGIDPQTKIILEIIAMLLTLPVIFYSGMPFIRNMLTGLRHLHFTMDSLIAIGAGSAFIYSIYQMFSGGTVYFDTSAMIITLILLGRYIEANAKGKASETIERLSELRPKEAKIILDVPDDTALLSSFETVTVPLDSVKKRDIIKVLPGERIPVDGIVVLGESEADEAILTGESQPVQKNPGSELIGGTVNLFGTLLFKVTRTGSDTVLAGIIRTVEDAQAKKPKLQILADRVVGYFVPAILSISFLTSIFYISGGYPVNTAIMSGISVLVIACPCSLGLATPLAVLVFTSMASSRGILIKSGDIIENISSIDQVIFDKTGTITEGKLSLREIINLDDSISRHRILQLAASIEYLSEHSIGHAVTSAYSDRLLHVDNFLAIPGRGVEGSIDGTIIYIGNHALMTENSIAADRSDSTLNKVSLPFEKAGDTVIHIGWDGKIRALLVVSDCLRPETIETVRLLGKLNKNISIVSGDNKTTTKAIASASGIINAKAEMTPEMKRNHINAVQNSGLKVLMAGDGINDAPALIEAAVGVAMGRGTDIAMESADAVLVRNDLKSIPYLIKLSNHAYRVIKQNIFWAFIYNIIAIPLAVFGTLHPIIAAGAMAASSLFVVLNSLRIRKGVNV